MIKYYTSLLLLLIHIICAGQDIIKFERLTTDDGLSEGFVSWILKDHKGFLWFGTRDGLNRYDGTTYKIFKNDFNDPGSLSNNVVQVIYETKDSTLFIGTHGGLNIYNYSTGTFTSYTHIPHDKNSLSNNAVYSIYEDRFGKIWVGTFGGGACEFDRETKTFKRFINNPNMPGSLSGNAIRGITEDLKGILWIGADGDGLNKYNRNNGSFTHFKHDPANPKSLGSDIVLCMNKDKKGNFWVGSWAGGVTVFDPIAGEAIQFLNHDPTNQNSLASNENFSIVEATTGDIWITTRNGLDLYDPFTGKITHNQHDPLDESSMNFNVLCFVHEDRDGILWTGTEGGGIAKLDLYKKPFQLFENNYRDANSLSNNDVTAVYQDRDGTYWIGTRNGLNKYDEQTGTFERMYHDPFNKNSLISNQIQTIAQDYAGYIWFGSSDKGVSQYNPETKTFINHTMDEDDETALSNNAVYTIVPDRHGYVWLGTYGGGVNKYDPETKTFTTYTIDAENNMQNVCISMYEDMDGVLWIGTMGHGLQKFKREKNTFVAYEVDHESNSISSNIVYSINETAGLLWIGTGGGGLDRFDKNTGAFKNFNKSNGLPADQILGILSDRVGNLWLGTAKGLARFNMKTEHIRTYDVKDGLSSNSFNAGSAFQNSRGEMLFGCKKGFILFNPDSIADNKIKPSVVITDFKIFNESVVPGENNAIKEQIENAHAIEIQPNQNNFTFEFAALHYSSPEKNQYKYKMEGYDKDWIVTDYNRRYATYTNLAGGEYTFTVIASNNDGVWNETGTSIQVTIVSPFWKTIWFYLLIACALGGIVYIVFRIREKAALKEKLHLESQVAKAVSEVEEQKKEILAQNASLQEKQIQEERDKWFNEGLTKFADILRDNKEDLHKLGYQILSALVRYIDACQAGMFVVNDRKKEAQFLELIASYAYNETRAKQTKIEIGEGLVGTCFVEKKTFVFTDLPKDYMTLSSSLGQTNPQVIVLFPLKFEEIIFGVIEIASLKEIDQFQIAFLEKLAENITSQLFTTKVTIQTEQLLQQSNAQMQELREQEEEIRQNIEKMQVNQELMQRQKTELTEKYDNLSKGIIKCYINRKKRFEEANYAFQKFTGLSRQEIFSAKVDDFFMLEEGDLASSWKVMLKEQIPIQGKITNNENIECHAQLRPIEEKGVIYILLTALVPVASN